MDCSRIGKTIHRVAVLFLSSRDVPRLPVAEVTLALVALVALFAQVRPAPFGARGARVSLIILDQDCA